MCTLNAKHVLTILPFHYNDRDSVREDARGYRLKHNEIMKEQGKK